MSSDVALEQYRPALTGHWCGVLGSVVDAEVAVQEAMLRARKSMGNFAHHALLLRRSGSR
jgi:DNA-directed RNA polymerase specialized sigma24 family protein